MRKTDRQTRRNRRAGRLIEEHKKGKETHTHTHKDDLLIL